MIHVSLIKDAEVLITSVFDNRLAADMWVADRTADKRFGRIEEEIVGIPFFEGGTDASEIVVHEAEITVVIEDKTAEVEAQKASSEALAYLAATDWMVIRQMDSGEAVPADVKAKRESARAAVIK